MGLLNLEKIRLSLESKIQRKKTQEEKERGFYMVADLLIELFDSGLLDRLDEEPFIIAKIADDTILQIYKKRLEIKYIPDYNDGSTFKCKKRNRKSLYKIAEMFDLTPKSIQELIDLLKKPEYR